MIRINLLPHREAKRTRNKQAFIRMLVLSGGFAVVVTIVVGVFIQGKITEQNERNTFITEENKKLDTQISEIATLKQDIEALKARQQAVEDLQSDRNQPAYLLDELVKQVPEGIFLHNFKQEGQKVSLTGVAQSNERVSEMLHNLSNNSPWLEHPELIESRSGNAAIGKDNKKVFEFTMSVSIKRLRDKEKAATDKTPPEKGSTPAAADKANKDKPGEPPADRAAAPVDKPAAKVTPNAVANSAAVNAPKKP
jgi:type IV pilus assembly protein PilN